MHREQRPPFRGTDGENRSGGFIIRRGKSAANALRRHPRDQAGDVSGRQLGQMAFQPAHGAADQQSRFIRQRLAFVRQIKSPAPFPRFLPDTGQIGLRPEIGPVGRFDQQLDHSFAPFQTIR